MKRYWTVMVMLGPLLFPGTCFSFDHIVGEWVGKWHESSCDGNRYSGAWKGVVSKDGTFVGGDGFDSVSGKIDPVTGQLTASGVSGDGCGVIKLVGHFDKESVSGEYRYGRGGEGTFSGRRLAKQEN